MRLPRLTMRCLMVLVAVAAFLLWSYQVSQRWVDCRNKVEHYGTVSAMQAAQANELRQQARLWRSRGSTSQATEADSDAEHLEKWSAYDAAMKRKYERAARSPWLPVLPDPPPPE